MSYGANDDPKSHASEFYCFSIKKKPDGLSTCQDSLESTVFLIDSEEIVALMKKSMKKDNKATQLEEDFLEGSQGVLIGQQRLLVKFPF